MIKNEPSFKLERTIEEISKLEYILLQLENLHASFDYLRVTIASPKRIRFWSERILPNGSIIGEVVRPETINFRNHLPEIGGLFCETIFGPLRNWRCRCGKYNGFVLDRICDDCHVELIETRVRRYRMGYIDLAFPVTHRWYLKGIPNYIRLFLKCVVPEIKNYQIDEIIYVKDDDSIDPNVPNPLAILAATYPNQKKKGNEIKRHFFRTSLKKPRIRRGSEIIKVILEHINIINTIKEARSVIQILSLRNLLHSYIPDKGLIRRIRILESFLSTKTNPGWMVLTILPVLPPNLRPLLELDSGRLVAADINEIYRLIITRNQRLGQFIYSYTAPDMITIHGKKLLQEGVDSLIDNGRLSKEKTFCLNNKALKSLTEILEGKQGRFRQSLLGKRVDYSARSVIVVGPNLRLNQCGLPYEIAKELFQPFLMNQLLKTKIKPPSHNTKLAQIIIKKNKPFVWRLLIKLTEKYSIILNRAPTLHRFGIQAFDPLIILGQAIHLHPLVCTGFNADFDGDQMAIHLPLYEVSQLETRTMMRPSANILSPSNGDVILKPTQDMVIGCYYLTLMMNSNPYLLKKWFSNEKEALGAFYQKKITLHTPILVRYSMKNFQLEKTINGNLFFIDTLSDLEMNKRFISLKKSFFIGNKEEKYYLITDMGIFIVRSINKNSYEATDLFLETTPGRLIFSINYKNSIEK